MSQRGGDPAAQGVDRIQPLLTGLGPGRAVAIGIFRPGHVPQPHGAVDLPLEHVVFQQVALFRRDSRQARFQPAEHILIFVSIADGGEHSGEEAQHRLFQNVAAAAEVEGNPVALKYRFNDPGVLLQIPGSHSDVPAAARSRRQQAADLRRGLLHLGKDVVRLPDPDAVRRSVIGNAFAEKVPLQMAQSGNVLPAQRLHPHGLSRLLRQAA